MAKVIDMETGARETGGVDTLNQSRKLRWKYREFMTNLEH